MKSYLFTCDAEYDLEAIKIHLLARGGPALVLHVTTKIEVACQMLGARPGLGHSRKDLTSAPVAFRKVFSYFVIYDPTTRPLHIIRVLHTSRDLKTIFRRNPPYA